MSDELGTYTTEQLIDEIEKLRGLLGSQLPTDAGGSIIGLDDTSPHARHGVVIDPRKAVLLENVDVVLIEPHRAGRHSDAVLGLLLAGRINKSTEHSSVLYLFDADGAAAIISELTGLATRIGPGFSKYLTKRLEALP